MHTWLSKAFLLLVGGLLIGGLVMAFWPQPVEVDLAEVSRGTLLVTVDEDGKTRIREKYVVSAPLAGRLLRVEMDPGDTVVAGQTLLATIQPRDPELLDARAIAQAEARVAAAKAARRGAESRVEMARIEADNAEAEFVRVRGAKSSGAATPSEFDAAVARNRTALAAIRAADHDREIAAFELQQAEAALMRSRQNGGPGVSEWDLSIPSPIDGRVLRVFQESAAVVAAGTPLLELGAPSDLEVEIDVLSSDAVNIAPGDRVLLERWGGDAPLEGRVRLVEPAGFTKVSSLGVEEQRVNVIIDLVAPPAQRATLGDGFRVEARIVTQEVADALLVPNSAMFRDGRAWSVFLVSEGRAQQTRVEVGARNSQFAEILEGLQAGDQVVAHPSDRVGDGSAVRGR